jgi:hypothetical protein
LNTFMTRAASDGGRRFKKDTSIKAHAATEDGFGLPF